jgi:DNA topoisomerase IB
MKELSEATKKHKYPNSFLFYFMNKDNDDEPPELIKPIDINNFLAEYHPDITLKMFRTWGANYLFLEEMIKHKNDFMEIFKIHSLNSSNNNNKKLIEDLTITRNEKIKKKIDRESEKIISEIIKKIAITLHNTPTVSKKSYLDNNLVVIYLENPKAFWKRVSNSHNKNDLNNLLVEFFSKNYSQKNTNKSKHNNNNQ